MKGVRYGANGAQRAAAQAAEQRERDEFAQWHAGQRRRISRRVTVQQEIARFADLQAAERGEGQPSAPMEWMVELQRRLDALRTLAGVDGDTSRDLILSVSGDLLAWLEQISEADAT